MALIQFNPKDPQDLPLIKFIRSQITDLGVGMVTSITGSPYRKVGNGKSYSTMSINEKTDPKFNIEKVCFTPREYTIGLNRIDNEIERGGGHFGYGQCLQLDEAQLMVDAGRWQGIVNRSISYTFSVSRNMRMNCIINTPSFSWIDKHIRNLVSLWGYPTLYMDSSSQRKVDLRLYRLYTDYEGERIYRSKLRFFDNVNRRVVIAKKFSMHLPSEELVEAYEKKATIFKARYRKDMMEAVIKFEDATTGIAEGKTPNQIYTEKYEKVVANTLCRAFLEKNGYITVPILKTQFAENRDELQALSNFVNTLWKDSYGHTKEGKPLKVSEVKTELGRELNG